MKRFLTFLQIKNYFPTTSWILINQFQPSTSLQSILKIFFYLSIFFEVNQVPLQRQPNRQKNNIRFHSGLEINKKLIFRFLSKKNLGLAWTIKAKRKFSDSGKKGWHEKNSYLWQKMSLLGDFSVNFVWNPLEVWLDGALEAFRNVSMFSGCCLLGRVAFFTGTLDTCTKSTYWITNRRNKRQVSHTEFADTP